MMKQQFKAVGTTVLALAVTFLSLTTLVNAASVDTAPGGNITLDGGFISNDGDTEGIGVDNDGNVEVTGNLIAPRLYSSFTALSSPSWIEMWGSGGARSGELTLAGTYLSFYGDSTDTSFGSEKMRMTSDGNLGIGTVTPTERLDVVGNGKVSGNMSIGGDLTVAGALNYSSLNISGDLTSGTATTIGNQSVGGTLQVTGATTLSSLNASGDITSANATTGNSTVNGNLDVNGEVQLNGGAKITSDANGNICIGSCN